MTSFVDLEYSRQHLGVERVESAINAAQHLRHGFTGARGLATLLLSAIAAAVMVVAYQVMDSVAEGHLLVIWIAMWVAAFVVLATFTGAALQFALRLKASLDTWSRHIAQARADERLWVAAQNDPRVMADLQCAMTRNEQTLDATASATLSATPLIMESPAVVASNARSASARKARIGGAALRAYQRSYI